MTAVGTNWDYMTSLYLCQQLAENRINVSEKIKETNYRLKQLCVDKRYNEKALIDGKQLSALIDIKPGKFTSVLVVEAHKWQLMNPSKGAKELEEYLNSIKESLLSEYKKSMLK